MMNTAEPPRVASNCGSKLLMVLAVTTGMEDPLLATLKYKSNLRI